MEGGRLDGSQSEAREACGEKEGGEQQEEREVEEVEAAAEMVNVVAPFWRSGDGA